MTPYLQQRTLFPPQIRAKPSLNLGMVVVIPAHDEAYLLLSLMSLKKCQRPKCDVEVIVVVNGSDTNTPEIKKRNFEIVQQAEEWARKNRPSGMRFFILHHPDLNPKHAGVGLARKIGMDEACWRLERVGNPQGLIVCFDADSRCTADYLISIEAHFQQNPRSPACSIYFEHPLCGADFDDKVYQAITLYELHLRYYIHAQRFAGFPLAYQTIGSSMAVRCNAYQKEGGMNRRKAGEDFYFLHKFTCSEYFTELKHTTVIPSPRPSARVPFGTGKAVSGMLRSKMYYKTYAPESFTDLKAFLEVIPTLYLQASPDLSDLPKSVREFLSTMNFEEKWQEIKSNTSNLERFQKRFYRWFDAFMVMKYLHFSRDHYYPNQEVSEAAKWLLNQLNFAVEGEQGPKDLLMQFRGLDSGKISNLPRPV